MQSDSLEFNKPWVRRLTMKEENFTVANILVGINNKNLESDMGVGEAERSKKQCSEPVERPFT